MVLFESVFGRLLAVSSMLEAWRFRVPIETGTDGLEPEADVGGARCFRGICETVSVAEVDSRRWWTKNSQVVALRPRLLDYGKCRPGL
jgi:hypothetical protein